MSAHQAEFPIAAMARVLGVSVSGYYAWRSRPASAHATSDAALLRRIRTIHAASHGTYGAPRVHAELQAEGTAVARKRMARLMRGAGLRGVSRRRFPTTTQREPSHRPANDLVGRDFRAAGPTRLWVADITYVPTAAGFLFLAVVLDVWSRRIVGWAMATDLRTRLVLDALDMAVTTRKPADVVHHSDQGSQYTSVAFGLRCKEAGVRPSTGSVGDAVLDIGARFAIPREGGLEGGQAPFGQMLGQLVLIEEIGGGGTASAPVEMHGASRRIAAR